jgi:leader peptidase (prepilin peptidase) / N-methyltransferase
MTRSVVLSVAGGVLLASIGLALALDGLSVARLAILGAAFALLVDSDLREHRIPNRVVLPAAALCGAVSLADGLQLYGLVAGVALLVALLVTSLALPAAFGMGDVKVVLLMLCALHTETLRALGVMVILWAVTVGVLAARRGRVVLGTALPLAPLLAVGSLVALVI